MNHRKTLLCSAMSLACVALAGQAMAQAAPSGNAPAASNANNTISEVVVTARRRAESLQNVPTAVTAFSQKQLTEKAVTSAYDLAKSVPGLTVDADSGNASLPDFSIRGRGTNFGTSAGSVEVYFADVPLSAPFQMPTLPVQYFDLQSFQVLKGPQGTLFGRTTTGGAVLVVPQAPTDQFGGYLRVQGGTYNDFQAEGAVNIPLAGDKAELRIAGFDWQRDGYMHTFPGAIDAVTGKVLPSQSYNNQNETDVRATLLLRPTDQLTNSTLFTFHTDQIRSSTGSGLNLLGIGSPVNPTHGVFASPGYGTYYTGTNVNLTRPGPNQAFAVINTTTYDLTSKLTLKNIFGFIAASGYTDAASDSDGLQNITGIDLPAGDRPMKNYQTTDEVQLQGHDFLDGRLSWVVGGLLDQTREPGSPDDISIFSTTNSAPPGPPTVPTVPGTFNTRFEQNTINSYSVYGSATYKLTDKLNLTAGYRHTWDNIQLVVANENSVGGPANTVNPLAWAARTQEAQNEQGNTYNADLDYHVDKNLMIYGGYRRGYKHGGFNPSALSAATASFAPETVDDFYAGIKDQFHIGDMPARFNIEGYYDLYHGAQNAYLSLVGGVLTVVVVNVPQTTFRGFDADLTIEPTQWLTLTGSYSLIDAFNTKWPDSYTDPVTHVTSTQSLTSNPVAYVSRNKVTFSARLHTELPDNKGELVLLPSVTYQDKFYAGAFEKVLPFSSQAIFGPFDQIAAGGGIVPAYATVDLRAEWNHMLGSKVDGAVNVTNLLNKVYYLGNSDTLLDGFQGNAYGPPRMITVELSTRF